MSKKAVLRSLVMFFNVLYVLLGFGLVGLGLWAFLDHNLKDIRDSIDDKQNLELALYAVMGIGGLMAITALCGCCGALHKSQLLLSIYFVLLLLILLGQLASIAMGFIFRTDARNGIREGIDANVMEFQKTSKPPVWFEVVQSHLKCCGGSRGVQSYVGMPLPASCCKNGACYITGIVKANHENGEANIFESNCPEKVTTMLRQYSVVLLGALLAIVAVEVFCMVCSLMLCCALRSGSADGFIGGGYAGMPLTEMYD